MSDSEFDILNFKNSFETNIDFSSGDYSNINLSANNNNGRYNDLIYDFFKDHFSKNQSTLIGEDIETNNEFNPIEYGGAFKVTKDMSILFPSFVKNTPISEQAITGIGIGLAISGISSFVEIMFGDFSTLVFDQILQHEIGQSIKATYSQEVLEQVEIIVKYESYIEKERLMVNKMKSMEDLAIPATFDYDKIKTLSTESRIKLKSIRPQTIGQASRISGVSAADVSILLLFMGR